MCLAIATQYLNVTDRQTDRHNSVVRVLILYRAVKLDVVTNSWLTCLDLSNEQSILYSQRYTSIKFFTSNLFVKSTACIGRCAIRLL